MKEGIHPEYRMVVFQDTSCGEKFLIGSTIGSKQTIVWEDGNEYPLVTVPVSSASHPIYTGKRVYVDATGRVEKFQKKYAKWSKKGKETPDA
jgi:large subunit ribosomal protein L31